MRRFYLLWKRGKFWYYRLSGEKCYHSTGLTRRTAVENFVVELLRHRRTDVPCYYTFRRYANPYFDWDRCPHVRRLREEGKSIIHRHLTGIFARTLLLRARRTHFP